jgi:tetrahydromethanopterin S-methyltransferase subunit G
MTIGPKALIITGIIAVACSTAIIVFMLTSKNAAHQSMQGQIDSIMKKMECPNNECDRYKGKDAARDLAIVHGRIDELEKNCDCKKK